MKNSIRFALLTGAPVMLALAASPAHAVLVSSFDNSSSFVTSTGFPSFGTYGLDNPGDPKVPNVRFDFGAATPTANHSISWQPDDAAGSASSGSVELSQVFSHTNDGAGASAFTFDIYSNTPVNFTQLSFDIRVVPGSAADAFGGYGFFQVATRDANYGFNGSSDIIVNGADQGQGGYELGNPTFSSPDAGSWDHVVVPLSGLGVHVRAVTMQIFNSDDRNINGPVNYEVDNLVLGPVPEPATLSILGLAAGTVLMRRKR